ncbi:VC0807 family protein [Bacillus carboniphilus]|uniref:VC0807 family protein n=1 Tax=Bacillus carboniphilus TaxID=86663 RepID=A0ABY9JVD9_9BACI|nr:VC0807 family protein [Bacillus carboniphilus]WLR42463.1 VC0807 family protein [Bacillus carboniphilus]
MKKNIVVYDIIFYLIFPVVMWNSGILRESLGDYYAMILSSVPGILYSIYRFFELKKINFFGVYILLTLIIGTSVELLAGSALQLLWNQVIFTFCMSGIFLFSMLINKPIPLYFAVDFAELQGYDKFFSKKLYYEKKLLILFHIICLIFVLKMVILASIKTWLIMEYGVEAFDKGIVVRKIFNWIMSIFTVIGFVYIGKIINDSPQLIEKVKEDLQKTKRSPA